MEDRWRGEGKGEGKGVEGRRKREGEGEGEGMRVKGRRRSEGGEERRDDTVWKRVGKGGRRREEKG